MPARTQLNGLQCTPGLRWLMSLSRLQTDVDHLSNDPHKQWAIIQQMFSHQPRGGLKMDRLYTATILFQWKLHSMFLNWNGRGNVSTHGRTEVTSNRTWKLTEIEPRGRPRFWHVALFACFVSDSGLQISSKHSSTHRRGWIMTAVHNETLFSPE